MSHQLGYFSWMLSFDIRSLESHAVVVDDDLSADDPIWERGDVKPGWGPINSIHCIWATTSRSSRPQKRIF